MNRLLRALIGCLALAAVSIAAAETPPKEPRPHRWLAIMTNLLVDKNVDESIAIMRRAAKAGYNGVIISDSKFSRWDDLPQQYFKNIRRFRQACRDLKLACIAAVCPIGYSNDLLGRDPNLAEGLPVIDTPLMAVKGKNGNTLVAADDSTRLVNGRFEQSKNNVPTGWAFVDEPGKVTFIDSAVKCEGRCSLRMHDIGVGNAPSGNGRACQTIAVKPFHYYHVSAAVKTQDFEAAGEVRIAVLAKDGTALNYYQPHVERTQDWKRIDVTFNSLEATQVNLYLGVWGGRRGTIWWDDVRIEPGGFVNMVRRPGAPLRITSADGKTVYVEHRDFDNARDPKLGMVPWPGAFDAWHEPPAITLPPRSRIKPGQTVLASYYHTVLIYEGQVACCMAEPKLYDLIRWQIKRVREHLQPDGYAMQHDEIRVAGWDESCRKTRMTPGQLLAENVKRCTAMIRREDPGKPIYVWSDMFDPFHNAAKAGKYYLVKGDGPWYNSWKGLPKDVGVLNWNSAPDKRIDSLRHFAELGHRQILAGYYDGPPDAIRGWLSDAAQFRGIAGVMYTTWQHRFDDLEKFIAEVENR
jgi:hypothetical protein